MSEHSRAVNQFVSDLMGMRMKFSETKNVVSASQDSLATDIVESLNGITVKVARRVVSLGSGLGAGTRRNMLQVKKRLRDFISTMNLL